MADFIVIPSNAAHLFQAEIEQAADRQVISIIDRTVQEVQRRLWKRVGVLGLGDPVVYTTPLREKGIACVTVDAEHRALLDRAIFQVMEGTAREQATAVAHSAVDSLRAQRVDGTILGCTEIPLLLRASEDVADLLNPAKLLAEAAVKAALEL